MVYKNKKQKKRNMEQGSNTSTRHSHQHTIHIDTPLSTPINIKGEKNNDYNIKKFIDININKVKNF